MVGSWWVTVRKQNRATTKHATKKLLSEIFAGTWCPYQEGGEIRGRTFKK